MSLLWAGWHAIAGMVATIRRARWPLPLAVAVLAGLALGYLTAARQPVLYEGVVRVLLAEPTTPEGRPPPADPDRTARNQAEIITSTPVLEEAARSYGDGLALDVIRQRVTVDTETGSNLLTIRVLDPTQEGAARLADSVVQAYDVVADASSAASSGPTGQLERQKAALLARMRRLTAGRPGQQPDDPALRAELAAISDELGQVVTRELQAAPAGDQPGAAIGAPEPAEVSRAPVQPQPKRMMAAGALLGLAVGGAAAWWPTAGRRMRTAATTGPTYRARPFRWFSLLLGVLLIGYMFFSKTFAYLVRIPGTPLFAGEVLLGVGLLEAVRHRSLLRHLLKVSAPLKILLALIALTGVRLLWDLPAYGMDAIRDYSIFYYGIIAFLVAAAAMSDPTFTPRLLRWYRRALPWFLVWVPIAIVLARHEPLAAINIPGSTTPINTFKGSDLAVMTTMALVFLWLGIDRDRDAGTRRRSNQYLTGLGVVSLLVLSSQGRAVMVVIPAVFGTAMLFLGSNRRRWIVLALAGSVAIILLPIFVFNLHLQVGGRELSLQQVGDNVSSIFSSDPKSDEAETGLHGTVKWRQELFETVLRNSLSFDRALAGRGFGPILSYEYLGHQPQGPGSPPPLRSAHNSHLTVLARTGFVCFGLWALLWVLWIRQVGRAGRRARNHGGVPRPAVGVAVWTLAGVAGLLVMAFNDPTLETPQGAIWLWALMGLGVAQLAGGRLSPHADPDAGLLELGLPGGPLDRLVGQRDGGAAVERDVAGAPGAVR
jgi:hypothetical protein